MRSAFNKDVLREIQKTAGRFLSIFAIVALGVAFYSGIGATGSDMQITGDTYFDEQSLMDIRILSNYGLNEQDIEVIKNTKGVSRVFPSYSMDALAVFGAESSVAKLHSINLRGAEVNKPVLLSGRLPENPNEVLVEGGFLYWSGLKIGDSISFESGKKDVDIRSLLRIKRFVISGVVESPYYVSHERGSGSIGSGRVDTFMLVPEENFLQTVYSEAFVIADGTKELACFADPYEELVDGVVKRLEDAGEKRTVKRMTEISSDAHEKLSLNKLELKKRRSEAEEAFDNAVSAIDSALLKLNENSRGIEVRASDLNENLHDIEKGMGEAYSALMEISAIPYDLSDNEAEIQKSLGNLRKLQSKIESGGRSLIDSRRELIAAEKELIQQKEQILVDKAVALRGIDEGIRKIDKSKEELYDLDEVEWFVLDRKTNSGYSAFAEDSDKIKAIGGVFPMIFFIVAALVSLTTMTRLVEERRNEIGALKALGYGNFKIMSKYLVYALVPTLFGSLVGGYIGMKLFPSMIIQAYSMLYSTPDALTPLNTYFWAVSTALALACTVMAAFFSCINELRETPCNLMRPRAPKAGKRIFLEYIGIIWKRLNFTQKVTVRNILRYKKRFLMTVIGISGCTALLMTGFGLRDSISDLMGKQFLDLQKLDITIRFGDSAKEKDLDNVASILSGSSIVSKSMRNYQKIMDAGREGGAVESVSVVVPEDSGGINDYVVLRERVSKKQVSIGVDGAVLSEKLAKTLGVNIGDQIYLKDGDDKIVFVRVTGIVENYIMHYVYLSEGKYTEIFEEKPEYNTIYTLLRGGESSEEKLAERRILEDKLAEEILDSKNVAGVGFSRTAIATFSDTLNNLNFVVFILIASAGALALVVLLNLTNINIDERKRELATIEVLGFYDKEVASYVYRENMVLTLIGGAVGLVLGIALHRYVIITAETSMMMFSREIRLLSYVYSMALTILFSLGVNAISSGKLKKINMVEALKCVE